MINREKLLGLEAYLRAGIIGQDPVIPRIAARLKHGELGLTNPDRPKGSFLFLGPTGVGKTELTLRFTEFLFGPGKLARFDMSEYQNQESVGRLIGRDRGDEGVFGQYFAQTGSSGTLLFDESEKAHPRVLDLLLQILDAARITLETGRTLDLSGYYVVCTSNIGAHKIMEMRRSVYQTLERVVLREAQRVLRPELFARVSEVCVFNRLEYDEQVGVAKIMLDRELQHQARNGYQLVADPSVLNAIIKKGYHPRLGARPMRSATEMLVRNALADNLLSGGKGSGMLQTAGDMLALIRPEEQAA